MPVLTLLPERAVELAVLAEGKEVDAVGLRQGCDACVLRKPMIANGGPLLPVLSLDPERAVDLAVLAGDKQLDAVRRPVRGRDGRS